jgi:glyoxylase-like metal-dependent hydrolase (beta-lactamase superfamily II)
MRGIYDAGIPRFAVAYAEQTGPRLRSPRPSSQGEADSRGKDRGIDMSILSPPIAAMTFLAAGCAHAPATSEGPCLYVLDCGDLKPMDPTLFGLKKEEIAGDASFVTPCYLIVHPKSTLVWGVGQIPDAQIADDGTEVIVQEILKAKRKLLPQLAALGYKPSDITYLAMSHYHLDHTTASTIYPRRFAASFAS